MGIQIEYMPSPELKSQSQSWLDKVLGVISFGDSHSDHAWGNIPEIHLNAPVLSRSHLASEVLLAASTVGINHAVISGKKDLIYYRCSGNLLFGVINLDESSIDPNSAKPVSALQQATETAYQQIFALIDELGYRQIYRFWNYMADINCNSVDNSLERYRQFNIGRKNIFVNVGRDQDQQLPAACALGLRAGPLSIAFLTGRTPAIAIENPRQVKAYNYPEQYGPRTPSFSRATLAQIGQQLCLFISGTASIVGHETLHVEDIIGQTRETLANLEAVVSEANRAHGKPVFSLSNACFRVYVRYAADLERIRETMHNHFKNEPKAVFVQADICREELLIEIEATLQADVTQDDMKAVDAA